MAASFDLPLRRDKTLIWDGVAQKRLAGILTLLDLTGAVVHLVCKKRVGDSSVMFALRSDVPTTDGRIDVDPDQALHRGEYTLRIEAAATGDASEFPEDSAAYYPFEIWVEEASGEITDLAYGSFQYSPDVE